MNSTNPASKIAILDWLRPTVLLGLVAVLLVVGGGIFLDRQAAVLNEQRLRSTVQDQVSLIRAKLEGNINGNIQLVRGLVSTLSTEPDMDQQRFAALVANLFAEDSQLRSVAAAPGLVVNMTYPLAGNERVIGLDYRNSPAQRPSVLAARDTGELVLAGPVDLVQGGQAFIARFPVFTGQGETHKFWGIVSAVVDIDRLYRDSGLFNPDLTINVAIIDRAATASGLPFFGTPLLDSPVRADIVLPSGTWEIAAAPKAGWHRNPTDVWLLRLAVLIAGALILLPIVIAERLASERQRHFRDIEHNGLHDSLTGLPNRRYLDEMLKRQAAEGFEGSGSIALLHIDLDRFKQINDTLGHAAGDAMLIHAATVLRSRCCPDDFVARIGGDEFVVVSSAAAGNIYLGTLAERIIAAMREPVSYEGHQCRFGVSIGIAAGYAPGIDVGQLLINADIALYRAKGQGRNRLEFFSAELQAEVVHTKRVADEILVGLERNEFVAYYQPQFCAHTHDVVGVEALARWNHPVLGVRTPDAFLPIAEDLNVVATLDRIMLEQALADLDRWEALGIKVPRASVNVSHKRLHDDSLIPGLKQLNITPGRIAFELVESIYLDESDAIVGWNIDQIKDLGIDVEIDDFGTGYASIVSLQKLRPARLKIDRQLVHPILHDPAQRLLLGSIVDIGKSMGIEVVAEGVETMEHAAILRDLGCDILQGYAFARPMCRDDLEAFLGRECWREAV